MSKSAQIFFQLASGFCLFFLILFNFKNVVSASGNLEEAKDFISNDTVGIEGVAHEVSFRLPYNSDNIISSDYIIIQLGSFTDITAATFLIGEYGGTPSFSLDSDLNRVLITGIFLEHGNTLTIGGITATNPQIRPQFEVVIIISEDEDGNIIKNIARFLAYGLGTVAEVTASIAPHVGTLIVNGFAAPGMFLTFTENGTIIGTDTAGGSNGNFTKYLPGLNPTTHNISIYGTDIYHRTTSLLPFEVYLPIYQETTVSNLLISPTLEISATEATQGGNLIIQGMTIPDGELSIFTESPLRTYYATASSDGFWDYTITNTSDYNVGDYRLYSIVSNGTGLQSLFSNSLQFTITTSGTSPTGSPGCDISEGDLNCDSSVNLADFSILMYYWGTSNRVADINEDELINLTDFSIMMYYWGT